MRCRAEVERMLQNYESVNARLTAQMDIPGAAIDDLASLYNSNALFICALQWVLGAETMRAS